MRALALSLSLLLALCACARATSLASSAAEAGSSAASSASDSLKSSSNSSGGDRRAEGRYRVTAVAQAPAGRVQLELAPEAGDAPTLSLSLPQLALAERGLTVGAAVQATPRPYGTEFAHADTGTAFFLVLDDAWQREMAARLVKP